MKKKVIKKDSKDAVDIRIVKTKKKKGKIIGLNDITGFDDQIGFGQQDCNILTEGEAEEKKKLKEGLDLDINKGNRRDAIIFLRRLSQGDKAVYIKCLEQHILDLYENMRFICTLQSHTVMFLNQDREILDRLPERIKALAMKRSEIDIIKRLKKDMGGIIKPESREKLIAERPTPERIKQIKILYFEQNFPESFMKELEKTENMTDDEYVAHREQQRKELIKAKRDLLDDLLKKGGR